MKTFRFLLALSLAAIVASCSTKVEPTASVYRLATPAGKVSNANAGISVTWKKISGAI